MKKIETVVQQLKEFRSEKVSVHKILQSMEDSGFPAVLLMLSVMLIAIPIPKIPPFNFFFGIPLLLFGWQMLKGQDKPSLPRWLEKKKIATEKIKSTADRIYKLLEKVEKNRETLLSGSRELQIHQPDYGCGRDFHDFEHPAAAPRNKLAFRFSYCHYVHGENLWGQPSDRCRAGRRCYLDRHFILGDRGSD